jgi:hypothetical protein
MRDTIDMAREAGGDDWGLFKDFMPEIERLVALVRADQDEKYKWDIHSCGPTCKRYACVAMREAVEAEREACAKLVEPDEEHRRDASWGYIGGKDGVELLDGKAAAIRARGNT